MPLSITRRLCVILDMFDGDAKAAYLYLEALPLPEPAIKKKQCVPIETRRNQTVRELALLILKDRAKL